LDIVSPNHKASWQFNSWAWMLSFYDPRGLLIHHFKLMPFGKTFSEGGMNLEGVVEPPFDIEINELGIGDIELIPGAHGAVLEIVYMFDEY